MKPTISLSLLPVALCAVACATTKPVYPTSALSVRGEVGGLYSPSEELGHWGGVGTLSGGFEAAGVCCGIGGYLSGLGHSTEQAEDRHAATVLSAGLELATHLNDHLGVQLRAGAAGTPPHVPLLGRRGFMGSGALVWRFSDPHPPPVSTWAALTELGLGLNWVSLNAERSAAGDRPGAGTGAANQVDLMLTLRVGANYGLELK